MAVKTQAELLAEVQTLLPDNSQIRSSAHRTLENDIIDTMFSSRARPYKVYVALLTQTGTDAPVATVLENTLSGTPVWSYANVGDYVLTLSGEFTIGKTALISPSNFVSSQKWSSFIQTLDEDILEMQVYDETGGTVDGALDNSMVEIRVYP